MSRVVVHGESYENTSSHGTKGSARSIRSLDTAVLMAEKDWRPESRIACETCRSEATLYTGVLLQDPETFTLGGSSLVKPRYAKALDSLPVGNANKKEEQNYFQTPVSSYTRPVFGVGVDDICGTDRSDISEQDTRVERRSTAFEMDDFENSSGSTTLRALSPSTNVSLDTKVLLRDPEDNLDYRIQTGHHGLDPDQNSSDYSSELDADDSSADDLVSARTVASLTTEVLLKPTEELTQVLGSRKAQKHGRPPKETHQVMPSYKETPNLAEFEMSSARAVILETKSVPSRHGIKSETTSTLSDKLTTSQHSKSKPSASKAFSKNHDIHSSRLSSERCFSGLVLVDRDEASPETASSLVSNGEGLNRRGTRNNVEHARMDCAFAEKFAQHHNDTSQSDAARQRSRFNQIQRSTSASRSRSGITRPSSVLDSLRSVETAVSLGQQIVRKSQENEKKTRQTTAAANNALSRSLMHDDESSSVSSQKSTFAFHDETAKRSMKKKKRNHTSNRVQDDILDGVLGLAVKGNTVPSRPLSSSSSLQEMAANEWTRRKKYNPRQSLQTQASLKRTGKSERRPAHKESEPGQQQSKNCADSCAKDTPSTSSDWTDDEEQVIPCGRDLSAVCQVSARVKRLSGQVLQALRKRPEFKVNEMILPNSKQMSSNGNSVENSSPEFLYIIHNLEAAERQMSAIFEALSSEK